MTPRVGSLKLIVQIPLVLAAMLAAMSGCGGSDSQSAGVPRPRAYARIQTYDTAMTAVAQAEPVVLLANAEAVVKEPDNASDAKTGTRWVNIVYPRYGATIFCTITDTRGQDRQQVIDNRVERMSLNTGGHQSEISEMENPAGWHSQIIHTPYGSVTPLQFLTTDGERWVVSGAMYLEQMPSNAAADSIAPIVDAVKADLIRSLSQITER